MPNKEIHPWTVRVMKEIGINVSREKPKLLTKVLLEKADRVIVMDSDILKNVPSKYLSKVENWHIEKLLGKSIEQIRKIRDQIKEKVEELINT